MATRRAADRRLAAREANAADLQSRKAKTAVAPHGTMVALADPSRVATPLVSNHSLVPISSDGDRVPGSAVSQPRTTVPVISTHPVSELSTPPATPRGNQPNNA